MALKRLFNRPSFLAPLFTLFTLFTLCTFCTGCGDKLRFAPAEEQKQVAFHTYQTALAVEASGTDAASPASRQLVGGTATALAYTGMPADPCIVDYPATVATASVQAQQRPTTADVIEQAAADADVGLSLAAQLALLFGVGASGVGGKKILDWIALAREKSAALSQIVKGNELFKQKVATGGALTTPQVVEAFKEAQTHAQKPATEILVKEIKQELAAQI